MAFAATNNASDARAFSQGPVNMQLMKWTCASGDTSGTITADSLHTITHVLIDGGLIMTAAPVLSGNTAVLAFNDPVATVFGDIVVFGK